ncbi:MAG: hypothetical protein K940chlam7_01929, partial [Chlamydiae bacterium]|nr:hypothetical protein [Chlamydiota bacterium]
EKSAISLAENFNKLNLDREQRLSLCKEITEKGHDAANALAKNFDKLGFIDDILQCEDGTSRLTLCMGIANQGPWTAEGLAMNIDKLGLDREQRLLLCKEITRQGQSAVYALVNNFQKTKLDGCPLRSISSLFVDLKLQGLDFYSYDRLTKGETLPKAMCRQLILEMLVPPHFENPRNMCRLGPFATPIKPLLDLMVRDQSNAEFEQKKDKFLEFVQSDTKLSSFGTFFKSAVTKAIKKAKPAEKPIVEFQLMHWGAYTAGVLYDMTDDQRNKVLDSKLLEQILEYRNPHLRYPLVRHLRNLAEGNLDIFKDVPKAATKARSRILVKCLSFMGISKEVIDDFYNNVCVDDVFKDTSRAKDLYDFLLGLLSYDQLSNREKKLLSECLNAMIEDRKSARDTLNEIEGKLKGRIPGRRGRYKPGPPEATALRSRLKMLKEKQSTKTKVLPDLRWLEIIRGNFTRREFFEILERKQSTAESDKSYMDFFTEKFSTLFSGLEKIDNLPKQYEKTFDKFRNKSAIFTYLGKVKQLPRQEQEDVFKALSAYVAAVLREEFVNTRYNFTEGCTHLKKVFTDEGIRSAWLDKRPRRGEEPQKVVLSNTASSDISKPDYQEFFYRKIITDKHLVPDKYPTLRDYLKGEEKDFEHELIQEETHGVDHEKIELQRQVIRLCQKAQAVEDFLASIQKMDLGVLRDDLEELKHLGRVKITQAEYTILESDDPCDLLLIGTEVRGSCQAVNGTPSLNKCLVGYLINGEILPIVVKDAKGKIVARSVMRLLWDEKNQKPVILQERLYDNTERPEVTKAINDMAIAKAKKMGVPLVSKEIGSGPRYEGTVEFLGGPAPFVYSDATRGENSGPFKVEGCHLLYAPDRK